LCCDILDTGLRLWLWCLTSLSTIFQLYRGGHFYWCGKSEYQEKTTDLPQVIVKHSHNVVSSTPRLSGIRTHNFSGDRHWLHRYIQLPYDHDGLYIVYIDHGVVCPSIYEFWVHLWYLQTLLKIYLLNTDLIYVLKAFLFP
jgi:hypothetical protein